MAGTKKSFSDSFNLNDRESCQSAIKTGGIAAMISAAITGAFAVAGFFVDSNDAASNYFLDPWLLVDFVLIVVLGIFVFRKSRVASTFLVIYFVVSKLIMWIDLGKAPGLIMTLIFLYFYVNAMRATYKWHAYQSTAAEKPA